MISASICPFIYLYTLYIKCIKLTFNFYKHNRDYKTRKFIKSSRYNPALPASEFEFPYPLTTAVTIITYYNNEFHENIVYQNYFTKNRNLEKEY